MKEASEIESGGPADVTQRLLTSAAALGLAPIGSLTPNPQTTQTGVPQSRRRFVATQCTQICIIISVCIITLLFHFITKDERISEALASIVNSYEKILLDGLENSTSLKM